MNYIINILVTALVVFGLSYILPGVEVNGYVSAIWVALAMSLLNAFVRPILVLLSLPITLLTLGLFLLIINALVIMLVDALVDGFVVAGFGYALLFSLCLSAVQSLMGAQQSPK